MICKIKSKKTEYVLWENKYSKKVYIKFLKIYSALEILYFSYIYAKILWTFGLLQKNYNIWLTPLWEECFWKIIIFSM